MRKLLDRLPAPLRRMFGVTFRDADGWWPEDHEPEPNTYSGETVSPESSMRLTAVWACRRVLAETIASLPLAVYERDERDPRRKNRVQNHHLYPLLHDEPNPEMDAYQWREVVVDSMTGWGNGYSFVEEDRAGRPLHLWPMHPSEPAKRRRDSGEIVYRIDGKDYLPSRIWHPMIMPALTSCGLMGRSPIQACRQAIGLGLGAEQYGARLFANDGRTTGVIEVPGPLGKTDAETKAVKDAMRQHWRQTHTGAGRFDIAIMDRGMQFKANSINPDDAQFLETRKFQLSEIARIYGMIPQLIGDMEKSTSWGTGIEQLSIAFVVYTLRPWLVALEQSLNRLLFSPEEKRRYFIEHNIDALLRGDLASRYAAYAIGKQWGYLNTNEIRALENLNPVEGGDIYLQPLNMVPAGTPPPPPKGFAEEGDPDRFVRALGRLNGNFDHLSQQEYANGNHD